MGLLHQPAVLISIHLHVLWINGGVNHYPRPSSQLAVRRDVDHDGLFVLAQGIDDVGAILEHLFIHVCKETGDDKGTITMRPEGDEFRGTHMIS